MSDSEYVNAAQVRVLRVVEALALAARTRGGLGPTDLAGAGCGTRNQAFRALKSMEAAGWVEQAGDGRWRLTAQAALASELTRAGLDLVGGAA